MQYLKQVLPVQLQLWKEFEQNCGRPGILDSAHAPERTVAVEPQSADLAGDSPCTSFSYTVVLACAAVCGVKPCAQQAQFAQLQVLQVLHQQRCGLLVTLLALVDVQAAVHHSAAASSFTCLKVCLQALARRVCPCLS
jgi:hypothetical protein